MSTAQLEGLAMLLMERGVALYSNSGPSSIFLEFLPERAEHALSLTGYASEAETVFPPRVSWPRIQVRARGDRQSPRWSRDRLGLVYHVLHGFSGSLPNGVEVRFMHGLQSDAVSLGPDASGRYEHVINFQAWVCDTVPVLETSHAST